jgi:protein required for attachment to host cells
VSAAAGLKIEKRVIAVIGIPGLFFVIACKNQARFVRPDQDNGLHTVLAANFTTLGKHAVARAGPLDPPDWQQIAFARLLAMRISEDFAVDLFSHLVLVAPPHVLHELTTMIDAPTSAILVGSLAKDLVWVPDLELWPHLLPWIQPGQIGWASPVPSHEW